MLKLVTTAVVALAVTATTLPASADAVATTTPALAVDDDEETLDPADLTLRPLPEDRPRDHRALALGGLGALYVGLSTWAYFAWYQDHPANHAFQFGGDGLFERDSYAGGSDKLGHTWATMTLARASSQALRFGGWERRRAAVIGSALATAAFTLVEYEDGYFYEFSYGDLAADVLGATAAAILESSDRADELFDFRIEYWPSTEYRSILRGEPGRDAPLDLKKVNIAEDYSGQTYLLALHLAAFDSITERTWTAPLRYVDAVVGFRSDKYRPTPLPGDAAERAQHLFVGASLNLQAVFDRMLDRGGTRGGVGTALHGVTEVVNMPFTSRGLGSVSRACPPPSCMLQ